MYRYLSALLSAAVLLACSKDDAPDSTAAKTSPTEPAPEEPTTERTERTFKCDALVPAADREKLMPGFEVTDGKGAMLAAKCIFKKPDNPDFAMAEIHCARTYSDEDIANKLEMLRKVLPDYKDMDPPLGRASWTRTGGNQVVFWDAESGCMADVVWSGDKPTLELARVVESNLR